MELGVETTGLLTAVGVIMGNIVTIITLYIHLDNKTEKTLHGMKNTIDAIKDEMKDFHGRLISLEERIIRERTKKVLTEMAERQY